MKILTAVGKGDRAFRLLVAVDGESQIGAAHRLGSRNVRHQHRLSDLDASMQVPSFRFAGALAGSAAGHASSSS